MFTNDTHAQLVNLSSRPTPIGGVRQLLTPREDKKSGLVSSERSIKGGKGKEWQRQVPERDQWPLRDDPTWTSKHSHYCSKNIWRGQFGRTLPQRGFGAVRDGQARQGEPKYHCQGELIYPSLGACQSPPRFWDYRSASFFAFGRHRSMQRLLAAQATRSASRTMIAQGSAT